MITIPMLSITYAFRAQEALKNRGYYCEVIKDSSIAISGCAYSIKTNADYSDAAAILYNNSIPLKSL